MLLGYHPSVCVSIALQRLRAPRVWFEILVLFFVWSFYFLSRFFCFFVALLLSTFFLLGLLVCYCFLRTFAAASFGLISFLGLSVVFYCSFCFLLKLCVCLFVCLFVSGGAAKKKLRTDGSFLLVNRSFR